MKNITAAIMAKNEGESILVTLNSLKHEDNPRARINSVCLYDTGSTDDTILIVSKWCKENNLILYLKKTDTFTDFSTDRNILLNFIDEQKDIDYALLLDANDELRGCDFLLSYIVDFQEDQSGWMVQQQWYVGTITKFFNVRFIKTRSSWRYTGVVHEYIRSPGKSTVKMPENIYIYQNRCINCESSFKRFARDRELLEKSHLEDPDNVRTIFYLASTYENLGMKDEAIKWYLKRTKLGNYFEEIFISFLRTGRIYRSAGNEDNAIICFLKAFECIDRAEPVVELAHIYRMRRQWKLAYAFAKIACELSKTTCNLFVEYDKYEYERWHEMGIIAYYVGDIKSGCNACEKAVAARNQDVDKLNLKFYLCKTRVS